MESYKETYISDIVIDNFFKCLKDKEISQKKYAKDNNIDESTLSKWKKGKTSPTLDQVKQAAEYFKITVNDLVYNEKEKKHIEVFANKVYDPILAQQSIKVKLYGNFFKKPILAVLACLVIFAFVTFGVFITFNNFMYSSLFIVAGFFVSLKVIYSISFNEKTFIVNYLDDIFYQRKDSKNKYYYLNVMIRIVSTIVIFYYLSLYTNFEILSNIQKGLLATLIFLILIILFSLIATFINFPKKFRLEIYDYEIEGYNSSKYFLAVGFAILCIAVLLSISDFKQYFIFLIVSTIILALNIIDFSIVSIEYSKYVLVYQENEKEPRQLFVNKN